MQGVKVETFARQGFRGDGLIAMTEASTLFSNISEMSVDEAAQGLTSIANGFSSINAEDILIAVDAINEVDNNFAISSQNIVRSIQKSVGSAETFGVTMQELIGYTTAIFFQSGLYKKLYSNKVGEPRNLGCVNVYSC